MYSNYKIIRGGIGDILQSLPFVMKNLDLNYIVITHFPSACKIFTSVGLKNVEYVYFNDLRSLQNAQLRISKYLELNHSKAENCPRSLYFEEYPFNSDTDHLKKFENNKTVIGIHPFGSEFSNNVYTKVLKKVSKNIDASVIESIIDDNFNYFIFGLSHELQDLGLKEKCNMKYIEYDDIVLSLDAVKCCSKMISSDSAFKTMSSMLNIKTHCLIPNIEDEVRDCNFIDPYIKDKVMNIYKFNDTAKEKEEIIKFINF